MTPSGIEPTTLPLCSYRVLNVLYKKLPSLNILKHPNMAASPYIAGIYNKTLITIQLLVTLATMWVWGECTKISARVL